MVLLTWNVFSINFKMIYEQRTVEVAFCVIPETCPVFYANRLQVELTYNLLRESFMSIINATHMCQQVRCIYCNGLLHHWEVKDVVNVEHKRNYPNCPFVRGANVGNIANMSPTNRVMNFVNGMEQRLITPIQESCSAIGHDIDPIEDGYGSMFINTGHRGEIGNRNNNVFGDFESLDDSNRNDISLSSQAAMKSMATEDARLDTFSHWSFHDKLSPDELVNAGLFSLG